MPMTLGQLEAYLVAILKGFVIDQNKVVVTSKDYSNTVIFHVSLAKVDHDNNTITSFTQRSLSHLMNKATLHDRGINGGVDPDIGVT